ncbi:MAG: hypothetical protein ABIN89_22555 [Chitinophagaceae bacterium]
MDLNDLKSGWQQAGGTLKSETDLQNMTKVKNHPSLKKIRRKLVIETLLMVSFLIIYYDWFDGDRKPLGINLLLVSSVLLIILNDIIGYIAISTPAKGANLKTYIHHFLMRIKLLSVVSVSLSFLYGISLLVFFSATITFTMKKYFIEAALVITLLLSIYFSYRIWSKWIKTLTSLSLEMEDNIK